MLTALEDGGIGMFRDPLTSVRYLLYECGQETVWFACSVHCSDNFFVMTAFFLRVTYATFVWRRCRARGHGKSEFSGIRFGLFFYIL
jgi:hypothetical protein